MALGDRLQGWNAIAEFLNCDVRTAKRWETERGLPVRRTRRTPGEGRPNVYALISEIEEWRAPDNPPEPALPTQEAFEQPAIAQLTPETPSSRTWLRAAAAIAIAIAIASAAVITLSARVRRAKSATLAADAAAAATVSAAHAANPTVQNLYMHATYLLEQRTPETLTGAKNDFERAIAQDAGFAPAYAGLAETYDLLREYSTLPSEQAYPKAKQAAERAIALDPNLADAHAALGYEEFFWEWDRSRAEAEFRRAIALDPNSANTAHWYGAMLLHETRFREAIEQLDRAQILEPASNSVLATRAYAIGLSGRRDEAVDLVQDILTRVPDAAPLHFVLAQLCLPEPRDIPRYLDQMRRYAELRHSREELEVIAVAGPAYQRQGEAAMWRAMLNDEQHIHPHSRTYEMAQLEAALGMHDAAIHDLELLEKQHDDHMIGLAIDPLLPSLHTDPRFQGLKRRVGLP